MNDRLPLDLPAAPDAAADRRFYGGLQAIVGPLLAGLVFFVIDADARPFAPVALVLWFGLSHGLHTLARRGRWFDEDAAALWPRLLGAGLALGGLWGYTTLVAYDLLENGQPLGDAITPFDGSFAILSVVAFAFYTFVGVLWTALYAAGHFVLRYRRAEVAALRLAVEAKDAELRALRAQVHPHFLFNALNSVRALVEEDPDRARDAVTRLARLLRHTLRASEAATVPLADELAAARDYLELEAVRFEDRLRVALRVEGDVAGVEVPPLVVLTLVENAVKHGVAPRAAGGEVALVVTREADAVRVAVTNPGRLEAAATTAAGDGAGGLGLRNTRARLALHYGDAAALDLTARADAVTSEVRLPVRPARTRA